MPVQLHPALRRALFGLEEPVRLKRKGEAVLKALGVTHFDHDGVGGARLAVDFEIEV